MARAGRSTAQARRTVVIADAVRCFGLRGWAGTTYADIAAASGISTAYVVKLFPKKEQLFVAALDECFARVEHALVEEAAVAAGDPVQVLHQLGGAYAHLIADRSVLMMQVHAQSAANVPAIGESLRHGLEHLTTLVVDLTGADDKDVQTFMAYGQLCHLVVTTRLDEMDTPGARLLSAGIRHDDEASATLP